MDPFAVKESLDKITVIIDTREQDTPEAKRRIRNIGYPIERTKLDFGDYSARCDKLDLTGLVAIERKMSLDELAQCYTSGRGRFKREFERAKSAGAKMYLLIEGGSIDKIIAHRYRSRLDPNAFLASVTTWLARYNCQLIFCDFLLTGRMIREILYREMKERLEALPDEH